MSGNDIVLSKDQTHAYLRTRPIERSGMPPENVQDDARRYEDLDIGSLDPADRVIQLRDCSPVQVRPVGDIGDTVQEGTRQPADLPAAPRPARRHAHPSAAAARTAPACAGVAMSMPAPAAPAKRLHHA